VTKVDQKTVEGVALSKLYPKAKKIWLRIDADFRPNQDGRRMGGADKANFYYSMDGETWNQIGTKDYRLSFDWRRFFMGTKFGIFCYATKKKSGFVDVDEFCYQKIKE
jgi:beta-xylosidase